MRRFLFILLACCISLHLKAQTLSVTGKVLDEKGQPLPGANIKVKNTTTGTVTNAEGVFKLNTASDATLTVSYIGYVAQEISVQGRKNITINLSPNEAGLN